MNKTNKKTIGNIGENIACEYLEDKSFQILEKNHTKPWGEIDIIAISPDKTLVFVEVKTMKHYKGGLKPEDQMTKSKMQSIKRSASLYAGNNNNLIKDEKGWRLDLIAITLLNGNQNDGFKLNHYTNIF